MNCGILYLNREYGTIDDVDIDLHINIGFLDVSQHSCSFASSLPTLLINIQKLTFYTATNHL